MESTYKKRKRDAKSKQFKAGFPSKASVETRVNAAIDSAASLAQLKIALKKILNGDGAGPGIIDALFHLDR